MNFWYSSYKEIVLQKMKLSRMILLSKVRTAAQIIFKIRSSIKRYEQRYYQKMYEQHVSEPSIKST